MSCLNHHVGFALANEAQEIEGPRTPIAAIEFPSDLIHDYDVWQIDFPYDFGALSFSNSNLTEDSITKEDDTNDYDPYSWVDNAGFLSIQNQTGRRLSETSLSSQEADQTELKPVFFCITDKQVQLEENFHHHPKETASPRIMLPATKLAGRARKRILPGENTFTFKPAKQSKAHQRKNKARISI